jgi:hypothetical protein
MRVPKRAALVWVGLVVAATVFGVLDVRRRARLDRGPKHHRTDLTVYLAASEALRDGADPYEARSPRGWRYVYPPLLAILATPLLALPVPTAALVVYALSIAALLGAWRWLAASFDGGRGRAAAAWALLLSAPFLLQTLQRGQVTIFLLAAQAGALLLLTRGRDALAGVVLALGTALRLTPILPAAMVALAGLVGAGRSGWRAALRFPAGVLLGLAVGFAVVPVLALGPDRALEVTERWLESSRDVYAAGPGALADLERDYAIDEFSHKNQGVRRVAATWAGVDPGDAAGMAAIDRLALGVAIAVAALAVLLSVRTMRDRAAPSYRRSYAIGVMLPVLVTRYAWPVHFAVAPVLLAAALARAPRPWRSAATVAFGAGMVLFYLGHLDAFRSLAEGGSLLLGTAVAIALLPLHGRRDVSGRPAT